MLVRYYSEIIIIGLLALLFVLSPDHARADGEILCATVVPQCDADGSPLPPFNEGPCLETYLQYCSQQKQQEVNAELASCNFGLEYTSNELLIAQDKNFRQRKTITRLRRKLAKERRKNRK